VRLTALSASRRITPLLARSAHGSVLAAFTRSAYVEIEGHIAVLAGARLLNGPLNVLLTIREPDEQELFTGLAPTTAVTVRHGILELDGRWEIDARQAHPWDPRLTPLPDAGDRARLLNTPGIITAILEAEAPAESLARPQARPHRAQSGMARMAHALRTDDVEMARQLARQAAEELAGLGPGLTPSGDDVLAGVLTALALLAPPAPRSSASRSSRRPTGGPHVSARRISSRPRRARPAKPGTSSLPSSTRHWIRLAPPPSPLPSDGSCPSARRQAVTC
jgi:hypothetical protein